MKKIGWGNQFDESYFLGDLWQTFLTRQWFLTPRDTWGHLGTDTSFIVAPMFTTNMSSVILSPLDSWQETKSFPLVSSKRIQAFVSSPQLSPSQKLHPIPKKKSSFLVDHELLQSIAPLLHIAECQSFCDRYFDNESNDLLLNVWLCYRSFFSEADLVIGLTSARTSETEKTIRRDGISR